MHTIELNSNFILFCNTMLMYLNTDASEAMKYIFITNLADLRCIFAPQLINAFQKSSHLYKDLRLHVYYKCKASYYKMCIWPNSMCWILHRRWLKNIAYLILSLACITWNNIFCIEHYFVSESVMKKTFNLI